MKHALVLTVLCLGLISCNSDSDMPAGYNAACYGGNFTKHLNGVKSNYSAVLDIPDSSWPQLKHTLEQVARKYDAKVFDTSQNTKALTSFEVSVCSDGGLFFFAEKRSWHIPNEPTTGDPYIYISVFVYKNNQRWYGFSKQLNATLRNQWPNALRVESPSDSQLLNSLF